jgi:DNA polymerase-3 subunit delta'
MWTVLGHNKAVSFIQQELERGVIASAYLFIGPPHVGKMTLALELAQALNCESDKSPCGVCKSCQKIQLGKHTDVRVIGLSGNDELNDVRHQAEISIDQVREVQSSCYLPPFEGKYKIFIIDMAERLSREAANSLLKSLEEPEIKLYLFS